MNKAHENCGPRLPIQQFKDWALVATYESASEAARTLGIKDPTHICQVAYGRRKTAHGFTWKYVDNHDANDVWKECAPGIFVSEHGKVKQKARGGAFKVTEAAAMNPNAPYPTVNINGKQRKVHRLVAEHFLPPPDDAAKTVVNHIDGNKRNSHVTNLEWCTPSQNSQHAHDTGLIMAKKSVLQFSKGGQFVARYDSVKEAARHAGCRVGISLCATGHRKSAGGYTWEYA